MLCCRQVFLCEGSISCRLVFVLRRDTDLWLLKQSNSSNKLHHMCCWHLLHCPGGNNSRNLYSMWGWHLLLCPGGWQLYQLCGWDLLHCSGCWNLYQLRGWHLLLCPGSNNSRNLCGLCQLLHQCHTNTSVCSWQPSEYSLHVQCWLLWHWFGVYAGSHLCPWNILLCHG